MEVPAFDGKRAAIAVSEGAQTGRRFRLHGKGMPALRGAAVDDLFVECVVETPLDLTDRQRDLLHQFESADAPGAHPESEGFMTRVKEFIDDLRG